MVCDGPSRTCNVNIIFEHVCHRIIVSTTVHLLNCAHYIYQPATPLLIELSAPEIVKNGYYDPSSTSLQHFGYICNDKVLLKC
jgi:hypothetical protein